MTPEDLRKRLLAAAEAIINDAVGKEQETAAKTLAEIEQVALKVGQEIKAKVLAEMVNQVPPALKVESCSQCGGKVQDKGLREKWVVSQAGEVQLKRHYYYCERCKTGFFPP